MKRALVAIVKAYRLLLSPWLGNSCRFEPTCSVYAIGALEKHGALAGSYLTAARLARCHPWCAGGHDPVPEHAPGLFTRLVRRDQPHATGTAGASQPTPHTAPTLTPSSNKAP